MTPKALTYDDGKPPLARLPLRALRQVALVQLYGAHKYDEFDNYRKGMETSRNASCAMRHIADHMDGQDMDPESGLPHLAHAACRILFMLENIAQGTAIDDRHSSVKASESREEELLRAIEDIACGTGLQCTKCGGKRPCNCEHGEGKEIPA
jgi:hypothetical protein